MYVSYAVNQLSLLISMGIVRIHSLVIPLFYGQLTLQWSHHGICYEAIF